MRVSVGGLSYTLTRRYRPRRRHSLLLLPLTIACPPGTTARLSPPAPPTAYRYRQFQELHTSLSALGLSAATLPRFPRKYSYKTQDERFVAKRREELEEYLAAVVADRQLRQCAELHQFLELGLLLGQIERGAGSRGMDRATR